MDFSEQLRVLQAADGNAAKLALATVDIAYPVEPETERRMIKKSLKAAAIPHWCDEAILAALLHIPKAKSARRLARMCSLKVVEPFPARGNSAVNVHEKTRLALRKRMVAEEPDSFRILNARAATFFEHDITPAGRIERVYHLLCQDPELGADELGKLDRDWSSSMRSQDRYALAVVLKELDDTGMVQGRARAWFILVTALIHLRRGDAAKLADLAREALELARLASDARAEANAQALLEEVFEAQGQQTKAQGEDKQNLPDLLGARTRNRPLTKDWIQEQMVIRNGTSGMYVNMRISPGSNDPGPFSGLVVRCNHPVDETAGMFAPRATDFPNYTITGTEIHFYGASVSAPQSIRFQVISQDVSDGEIVDVKWIK